jgi:hypothetical protein
MHAAEASLRTAQASCLAIGFFCTMPAQLLHILVWKQPDCLQVPSSFKQGAARLDGVVSYYVEHESGNTSPSLPYPDLATGQKPTHEQLVDMMSSLGAATMHFYCVLYCMKGRDHSKMSAAAVNALSSLGGASTFLPAMRHVLRAVLPSDTSDRNNHRAADQAVSDAAAMLPVSLLEAVRKTNSECCLWCGKSCSQTMLSLQHQSGYPQMVPRTRVDGICYVAQQVVRHCGVAFVVRPVDVTAQHHIAAPTADLPMCCAWAMPLQAPLRPSSLVT